MAAGRVEKKITVRRFKRWIGHDRFIQFVNPERLQVIGSTEMVYFETLDLEPRNASSMRSAAWTCPACVYAQSGDPELLLQKADEKEFRISNNLSSVDFIERVTQFLEEKLAPPQASMGFSWMFLVWAF